MKSTRYLCHNPVYIYKYGQKTILGCQPIENYDGTFTIRNPIEITSFLGRIYLRSFSLYNCITIPYCSREKVSEVLNEVYSRFILIEYIVHELPGKEFLSLMRFNYFSRLLFPFIALANLMSGDKKKSVKEEIVSFNRI